MEKKKKVYDAFSEMENEFERMHREMASLMEEVMGRMPEEGMERLAKKGKAGVYGFSVSLDNEGKAVVREFGNVKPEGRALISEEREPLVDVIEGKESITVMVELPGVDRKDIRAKGEGRNLTVSVNSESRKYYKGLELPSNADFANAAAKYNNGVLEIILQRHGKGTANGSIRVG